MALIRKIFVYFGETNGFLVASGLAYTTLVSLVPLMVVIAGILSVFDPAGYGLDFHQFLFKHFLPASADLIRDQLETFRDEAMKLSAIALIPLVVSALLLINMMETALNSIWRAKARRGLNALITYWAFLTLLPAVAGSSFSVAVYFFETVGGLRFFLHIAAFFLGWAGLTLLYVALPNCKVRIRYGLIGGLVAALLVELAKFGFGYYVDISSYYSAVFGALAAVPIFLLWLYLIWIIVIFGAVVTFVSSNRD